MKRSPSTAAQKSRSYRWRSGMRIYKTSATEFGQMLEAVELVRPEDLVPLCREPGTPGHDHIYRYADAQIVQMHREERARELIVGLEMTEEIIGGLCDVPVFPSVPWELLSQDEQETVPGAEGKEVWVPIARALGDDEMREHLAKEAGQMLYGWRDRLSIYADTEPAKLLAGALRALDKAREHFELL